MSVANARNFLDLDPSRVPGAPPMSECSQRREFGWWVGTTPACSRRRPISVARPTLSQSHKAKPSKITPLPRTTQARVPWTARKSPLPPYPPTREVLPSRSIFGRIPLLADEVCGSRKVCVRGTTQWDRRCSRSRYYFQDLLFPSCFFCSSSKRSSSAAAALPAASALLEARPCGDSRSRSHGEKSQHTLTEWWSTSVSRCCSKKR